MSNKKAMELLNGVPQKIYKIGDILKQENPFIGLRDFPTKDHPKFTQMASYFYYLPVVTIQDENRRGVITDSSQIMSGVKIIANYPYVGKKVQKIEDEDGNIKEQIMIKEFFKDEIIVPHKTEVYTDHLLSQRYYKTKRKRFQGGEIEYFDNEIPVSMTDEDESLIKTKAGLNHTTITCCPTNMAVSKQALRKRSEYKAGIIKEYVMMDFGKVAYNDIDGNRVIKDTNPQLVPVKYDDSGINWASVRANKEKYEKAINRSLKVDPAFLEKYQHSIALREVQEENSTVSQTDRELLDLFKQMTPEEKEKLLKKQNKEEGKKNKKEDLNI
jgi:hypothetical protein